MQGSGCDSSGDSGGETLAAADWELFAIYGASAEMRDALFLWG